MLEAPMSIKTFVASRIAYLTTEAEAQPLVDRVGANKVIMFDGLLENLGGTQVAILEFDNYCIIAYRGTEFNKPEDIETIKNFDWTHLCWNFEDKRRVHLGFKRYAEIALPFISDYLKSTKLPAYFTGHSLGGGASVIVRALLEKQPKLKSQLNSVYTFGCPRVGNAAFRDWFDEHVVHYRYVNGNDGVTQVPLLTQGFRHCGTLNYFTSTGSSYWQDTNWLWVELERVLFLRLSPLSWVSRKVSDHYLRAYGAKLWQHTWFLSDPQSFSL